MSLPGAVNSLERFASDVGLWSVGRRSKLSWKVVAMVRPMQPRTNVNEILVRLRKIRRTGKAGRVPAPSLSPDQHALEQSDSWLAPELLEMLMATVRIALDGEKVVDLAVLSPELYEQGELWWPLDLLREDILPQRRADD
jgi:hypothetical protein